MFYSEYALDRAENLRRDPERLAQLAKASTAKLIPWTDAQCLFVEETEIYVPVFLSPLSMYVKYLDAAIGNIFMGFEPNSETPVFAGRVLDGEGFTSAVDHGEWLSLRSIGPRIDKYHAAIVAAVNGMMEWHVRNQFCGKTGESMLPIAGGHSRKAETNGSVAFPRIDPAIICLVTCGEYCLLGRKPSWNVLTRYSLLAGFLEVGETLEQAVEREVFEESAVKVDPETIVYKGSQPWPFPQSMMVGFVAGIHAPSEEPLTLEVEARKAAVETGITEHELERYLGKYLPKPVPQPEEMEDVRWFHFNYMKAHTTDNANGREKFCIPDHHAIANKIIVDWMSEIQSKRTEWEGENVCDVRIDEGRFKYILVRISDGEHSKIIVRGLRGRAYHMNILEEVQNETSPLNLEAGPLGGGRIEHDASQGDISIYGYSSAYGTALHDIAAVLCKRAYPYYDRITVSYSGY